MSVAMWSCDYGDITIYGAIQMDDDAVSADHAAFSRTHARSSWKGCCLYCRRQLNAQLSLLYLLPGLLTARDVMCI
jgi:hypothetical protein